MWKFHAAYLSFAIFGMYFTLDGIARRVVSMETQVIKTNKSPHFLIWIVGIAIILFCFAGIAAIMGWIPTSIGHSGDSVTIANSDLRDLPKADLPKPDQQLTSTAKPDPKKIHAAPSPVQVATQGISNAPTQTKCAECGVIESIHEVNTKGEGTGLGIVGGAVVGGLLGNQVGGGRGKDIATVAGAVGGGVAGHQIEKSVKSTKSYDITVRFEDGSSSVIHHANPSAWHLGDRVKVIDGVIRSND